MTESPKDFTATIRETVSRFVDGITGGRRIDSVALCQISIEKIRALVLSELKLSTLRDHLKFIDSKGQLTMACYVAADFVSSHPLEYQAIVAQLTIFFFHADDIIEHCPQVRQNLQLNVATGKPTGDPVMDWFARELTPRLWKHFDPLIANMILVACYDLINGISIEGVTKSMHLLPQVPEFPEWLRSKTGLSTMYSLLALARVSDVHYPTGGVQSYIQVIPSVNTFTNIVNDVLSFYKEFLAHEKGNYIDMVAERDGVDVLEALRTTAEEGIRIYKCISEALTSEPEYADNFDVYAKGITHFHTSSPRYRLKELFSA